MTGKPCIKTFSVILLTVIFPAFFQACAPKRVQPSKTNIYAGQSQQKTGFNSRNVQIYEPAPQSSSQMQVTNIETSVVHKGENRYPYISFSGDRNRDYVSYQICQGSRCEQGITAGEDILVPSLFEGIVVAQLRSCLRKERRPELQQDLCGPTVEKRLTLTQTADSDPGIDRLMKAKYLLSQEVYALGQKFSEALHVFEKEFQICLQDDSSASPVMSKQTRNDYLALGPDKLGYALLSFDQKKFDEQMQSGRKKTGNIPERPAEKESSWGEVSDRALFGIMGFTAGAGMIASGVATDANLKVGSFSVRKIIIGAGVLSAAAGAIMFGFGVGEMMSLSSRACAANEKLKSTHAKIANSARGLRDRIAETDEKIRMLSRE